MADLRSSSLARRFTLGWLPTRRLLAVDAGSSSVKLLLVEEMFGRLRVLDREVIDLPAPGEEPEGDCRARARALVEKAGDCPVALALPHYRALSQVLDLPSTDPDAVQAAIEEESLKLSGLGESEILHDYSRLAPFGRYTNPFWVTFCQESEVQRQIERCELAELDLCEVTTTLNALVAAYQAAAPLSPPAVLIDLGADGTLVCLLVGGQPVYATSFAVGTAAWVETLARELGCEPGEARERLRGAGFWRQASGAVQAMLRRWQGEVRRVLAEWLKEHPDLMLSAGEFRCVLAGGGAELPGLLEMLQTLPEARFVGWPEQAEDGDAVPVRFAPALGAALHALGRSAQPASLLPEGVRAYWRRNHSLQLLQSLVLVVCVGLALGLAWNTWQMGDLLAEKRGLRQLAQDALVAARATATLQQNALEDYELIRPILQRQRKTVDTLATLALLQDVRSNRSLWYVLFASAADYAVATPFPSTNAPPALTNTAPSNAWNLKRDGFVTELCTPESGEAGRRLLSQVVAELRQSGLFQNVDSLPDDRRRPLADPEVVLGEGHFALELDPVPNPFLPAPAPERQQPGAPTARSPAAQRETPTEAGRQPPGG